MNIEKELKNIFKENLEISSEIESGKSISEYITNSIDFIKIIVGVETKFDIEFEDEDLQLERFQTINDIIEYIQQKVNEG